ncbi:DUF4293 family protein, partial [Arthrospira platensis SPKY1]|nr:DUF4293 family protein [Arthrospira platensis SPKY1]
SMIQRIQTLFLLLAAGLTLALLGLPFAETPESVDASPLFSDGSYLIQDSPALLVLYLLGAILAIAAIFLFKRRTVQLRVSIFSFIAILLGMVMTLILFLQDPIVGQEVQPYDGLGVFFP